MNRPWKAALAVLATIGAAAAAPPPTRVAQLAWLSGAWAEERNGAWTEERWAPPRGGVMLGASLSGKGGRASDFEFTRIAADASGAIHYWASVKGAPAVPFRLVSASASEVVFENPQHDYPTRIAYRRDGAMLLGDIRPGRRQSGALALHAPESLGASPEAGKPLGEPAHRRA